IARHLGDTLGKITLTNFPDGEISVRIEEDVRGRDIYLVQPTCPPVNENLMELLVMLDCFKRASAARITAVIPYYGYARQDRKDQGRVPITAKLVADLVSVAGADRVLALDLHAAQIQGFFDVPVDHLHAGPAIERLRDAPLRQIVVTDSIPVPPSKHLPNLTVLSVAPLLADAIKRIHLNESVSKLFE